MFISKHVLRALLVVLLMIGYQSVHAEEFRVNLIATIDDDPAMESVEWTVYRNGSEEFTTAKKHLTHVNIPAGVYKVVAKLTSDDKTIIRSRNFHVRNDTNVVVPMD